MTSWKMLFKSENFISAVELGDKKPTMTIVRINQVRLEQDDGKEKDKPVVFFKEITRGWVFCKTTGFCLSAMFGDDYEKWVGKRVTLHSEMVQVGKDMQPGIRVSGSPDIDKPMQLRIKLPKRKGFVVKLVPTVGKHSVELKDPTPQTEPQATPQ